MGRRPGCRPARTVILTNRPARDASHSGQALGEEGTMSGRRGVVVIPLAVGALFGASGCPAHRPTTRRDRRQRGEALEPSRGDDARRGAGTERRRPPRSRSTWAWCREPCTTRSMRSGRSSIAHIFSTGAPVHGRPSTPLSRRLPMTCSRSWSRRHRRGCHSSGVRDSSSTLSSAYAASLASVDDDSSRGRASRWDTQRPRRCSTRERATDGSGRQRGCRTPRPDTGRRPSPAACPSSTRPRGPAT